LQNTKPFQAQIIYIILSTFHAKIHLKIGKSITNSNTLDQNGPCYSCSLFILISRIRDKVIETILKKTHRWSCCVGGRWESSGRTGRIVVFVESVQEPAAAGCRSATPETEREKVDFQQFVALSKVFRHAAVGNGSNHRRRTCVLFGGTEADETSSNSQQSAVCVGNGVRGSTGGRESSGGGHRRLGDHAGSQCGGCVRRQ
jgi:hypothetical protein